MNKKFICLVALLGLSLCDVTPTDQTAFYNKFTKQPLTFDVETGYVSQQNNEGTGNTFYHLVYKVGTKKDTVLDTDPFMIWLNGGPGCSSQFGLFGEVGPFVVTNTTDGGSEINLRAKSWNNLAIQLFVDQPFGAGLSYTDSTKIVSDTTEAALYFSDFLAQFYQNHPALQKNPLYIFGESFAGHYIPAISVQILTNPYLRTVNFQGIGIGDGWTSPFHQLSTYSSFLYSAGLVDNLRRNYAQSIATQAQAAILQGDYAKGTKMFDIDSGDLLQNYTGNTNPYNFQQYNSDDQTIDPYVSFLNTNKATFGAPPTVTYQDCNHAIYSAFTDDIVQSRESDLVQVLEAGKKVLLFNGQLDYIVNTAGALLWINQMKWKHIQGWKDEGKKFFKLQQTDTSSVGWYKIKDNFQFVSIYKAGHMVPSDQPEVAFAMFQHYLNDDWD